MRTKRTRHSQDAHCTLDANNVCTVCAVFHGDPCPACGGRGYHAFNAGNRYQSPVQCDHCATPATVILGRNQAHVLCAWHANGR